MSEGVTLERLWPEKMLVLDRTDVTDPYDILQPFAMDELLCKQVAGGMAPVIHLWRHPRALVMGLRDSRLPNAYEAKRALESDGYQVAVRNSGGAAVPLDLGVVNISIIVPKEGGGLNHRREFEMMYALVRRALRRSGVPVDKGEIAGSYCPGDFDLAIGGRKFCGIAQRRLLNATAVQAFVVVEGAGEEKARLAQQFYSLAAAGASEADFPRVERGSMASLSELTGRLTAQEFTSVLLEELQQDGELAICAEVPSAEAIADMVATLRTRYDVRPPAQ